MLTRRCVGRIQAPPSQYRPLLSGGTRPCMAEGVHCCSDGRFRCATHREAFVEKLADARRNEVSERTAIEEET